MTKLLAPRSLTLLAPIALLSMAPPARGQCTVKTLTYRGGPVVSSLQVVQVEWGPGVASYASQLPAFYSAVLNSPFMDLLVQYDPTGASAQQITRGSFVGRYAITPSVTSTSVDDTQVQAELTAQIAAGHLPAPAYDAQSRPLTVYMIEFPSTVTIALQGSYSCQQFCSYHSSFTSTPGAKLVLYGVHPDVGAGGCAMGCGTGTALQNATTTHSHNIAEVVTDPAIGNNNIGWYNDTCGEIGDICNGQTTSLDGYTVQEEWSNKDAACLAQPSAPVPICDGTNASSCRPCVTVDAGPAGGCTGATPSCDLSAASATYGRCIAAAPPPSSSGGGHGGGCTTGSGAGLAGLLLAGLALRRTRRRA